MFILTLFISYLHIIFEHRGYINLHYLLQRDVSVGRHEEPSPDTVFPSDGEKICVDSLCGRKPTVAEEKEATELVDDDVQLEVPLQGHVRFAKSQVLILQQLFI